MPTKGRETEMTGHPISSLSSHSAVTEHLLSEIRSAEARVYRLMDWALYGGLVAVIALEVTGLLRGSDMGVRRVAVLAIAVSVLLVLALSGLQFVRLRRRTDDVYGLGRRREPQLPDYGPLLMRALEVFGESDRATSWMYEPNPALGDRRPIDVATTHEGKTEVLNILGRIEHGVLS